VITMSWAFWLVIGFLVGVATSVLGALAVVACDGDRENGE